jgi:hypothetical protein
LRLALARFLEHDGPAGTVNHHRQKELSIGKMRNFNRY